MSSVAADAPSLAAEHGFVLFGQLVGEVAVADHLQVNVHRLKSTSPWEDADADDACKCCLPWAGGGAGDLCHCTPNVLVDGQASSICSCSSCGKLASIISIHEMFLNMRAYRMILGLVRTPLAVPALDGLTPGRQRPVDNRGIRQPLHDSSLYRLHN